MQQTGNKKFRYKNVYQYKTNKSDFSFGNADAFSPGVQYTEK